MIKTFYHGTSEENAKKILAKGFDLNASRISDPGDFGWAIYFTTDIYRARSGGKAILEVDIDISNVYRTEYTYGEEELEKLDPFWANIVLNSDNKMGTLFGDYKNGIDRISFSKRVREKMLSYGYTGFYWKNELAVYDPSIIKNIKILEE